jgi:hypothetical protein
MPAIKIIVTKGADPELVAMVRKSYHRVSGTKGFCNPAVSVEK